MEAITLRLPPDLISELDAEATEVGFSSRSEYIRHLLRNRSRTHPLTPIDPGSNTIDTDELLDLRDHLEAVESELSALESRVTTLEEDTETQQTDPEPTNSAEGRPVPLESFASSKTGPDTADTDTTSDAFAALEGWLRLNGPSSGDARTVMVEAARLLDERGPLETGELRNELWKQFPNAYGSAETLWASTVQRLHEETPGFERPERGVYAFDRNALNQ